MMNNMENSNGERLNLEPGMTLPSGNNAFGQGGPPAPS